MDAFSPGPLWDAGCMAQLECDVKAMEKALNVRDAAGNFVDRRNKCLEEIKNMKAPSKELFTDIIETVNENVEALHKLEEALGTDVVGGIVACMDYIPTLLLATYGTVLENEDYFYVMFWRYIFEGYVTLEKGETFISVDTDDGLWELFYGGEV